MTRVRAHKIPKLIKKLNKALGLKPNSEKIWDILFVSDLKDNMTGMAANINTNEANINKNMVEIRKHHPKISK